MTLSHILCTCIPAWGHARPLCILAARLAKEKEDVAVSLVLPPFIVDKAKDEISSELYDVDNEDLRKRIRVISSFKIGPPEEFDVNDIMNKTATSYSAVCALLIAGKPVTCATTGTVFEGLPAPSLIIIDFVASPQYEATRAMVGDRVPIVVSLTGHAATMIGIFGPESLGGSGDLTTKSQIEAARLGMTYEEFGDTLYKEAKGAVVKLPGVPEMYDYELYPQELPWKDVRSQVLKDVYRFLQTADGVLLASSHAWEGEAIDAINTWFSDWGKRVYSIGPLLPSRFGVQQQSDGTQDGAMLFLDSMLHLEGKRSVILISLGSVYWPAKNDYLEEIIDALIEKHFPFILSHASPYANISHNFSQKVVMSGIGYLAAWCPQQRILNHPATGWFLSHCGHSSVTESLSSGIPIIAWPFEADQPATALQLVSLNVAVELLEVRYGENALKPLRRNEKAAKGTREAVGEEIRVTIDSCRSTNGAVIRKNAEEMKKKLGKAWNADGPARNAFEYFVKEFIV